MIQYGYIKDDIMTNLFSIRPSKDLRNNYQSISKLAKKMPVAITVNGKQDCVLLSHEQYFDEQNYIKELEEKLSLYEHLAQAEDDIKLGRVRDSEDVFKDLMKEIEEYEL